MLKKSPRIDVPCGSPVSKISFGNALSRSRPNMAQVITGRTRPTKVKKAERTQKRKRHDLDAENLERAVQELVGGLLASRKFNE